jgi:hypothetical protein
MLGERAIVYQVPDGLRRFVDAEPAEVRCGVPVLAAFSVSRGESGPGAEDCLEAGDIAVFTEYCYSKPLGGGVLLH